MRYTVFLCVLLLAACTGKQPADKGAATGDSIAAQKPVYKLKAKSVPFLWRADRYDPELKDTFNTIIINEDYCKTISEPERAALGYVATFVGSECDWDGKAGEGSGNLKCKVLTALNLGYQCSETHLGFLRTWFRSDTAVLHSLEDCPEVPFTASSQNSFDTVGVVVKADTIRVIYGVSGVNMRTEDSWHYTGEDIFVLSGEQLSLVKKNESEIEREKTDMDENDTDAE